MLDALERLPLDIQERVCSFLPTAGLYASLALCSKEAHRLATVVFPGIV